MYCSFTAVLLLLSPVAFPVGRCGRRHSCLFSLICVGKKYVEAARSLMLICVSVPNDTLKCIYHQHHFYREYQISWRLYWFIPLLFLLIFSGKVSDNCHDATINSEIRWICGSWLSVNGPLQSCLHHYDVFCQQQLWVSIGKVILSLFETEERALILHHYIQYVPDHNVSANS